MARLAFFTTLGVTARLTARPGCIARRTLRGTSNLEKNPISTPHREPALERYACQKGDRSAIQHQAPFRRVTRTFGE
jgi:hypothetical protein